MLKEIIEYKNAPIKTVTHFMKFKDGNNTLIIKFKILKILKILKSQYKQKSQIIFKNKMTLTFVMFAG